MKIGARPAGAPARTPFVPTGTYDGAELRNAPVRPGAMAAYALPSLVGGKPVSPAQIRAELRAPAPAAPAAVAVHVATVYRPGAAPTTATARPLTPYTPQRGSVPDRVIRHLRRHGGVLTRAQVSEQFGTPAASVVPTLLRAVQSGHLARLTVAGIAAYGLGSQAVSAGPFPAITTEGP